MKVIINLQKDEGLAFKNFSELVRPASISEPEFMKAIFLTGIEAMQARLTQTIKDYAKANKNELASSGIEVIEDENGDISLKEAPTPGVESVQA